MLKSWMSMFYDADATPAEKRRELSRCQGRIESDLEDRRLELTLKMRRVDASLTAAFKKSGGKPTYEISQLISHKDSILQQLGEIRDEESNSEYIGTQVTLGNVAAEQHRVLQLANELGSPLSSSHGARSARGEMQAFSEQQSNRRERSDALKGHISRDIGRQHIRIATQQSASPDPMGMLSEAQRELFEESRDAFFAEHTPEETLFKIESAFPKIPSAVPPIAQQAASSANSWGPPADELTEDDFAYQ